MKFNQMTVLKICAGVIAMTLLLFAGNESVQARRHGKKNSDERGKRKSRRNHARRRDMERSPEDSHTAMLSGLYSSKLDSQKQGKVNSTTSSTKKTSKEVEATSWTEAALEVSFGNGKIPTSHSAFGKFGYHSRIKPVFGKVVHLYDPNLKTHYGCNHYIGNREQIPQGEPWIALIERGKCYFFNKIRLAEVNRAAAVVIYNDRRGRTEIMNTAGTKIVSLMINKEDGHKIISMIDAGSSVTMTINVGRSHNSSHSNSPSHKPSTKAPVSTTTGDMHENISTTKEAFGRITTGNHRLPQLPRGHLAESASANNGVDFTPPNDALQLRVSHFRILVFSLFCTLLCAALNIT